MITGNLLRLHARWKGLMIKISFLNQKLLEMSTQEYLKTGEALNRRLSLEKNSSNNKKVRSNQYGKQK